MTVWRTDPERRQRTERQLEEHPLCAWCLQQGRIAVATAVSHELQSLCKDCYARHASSWPWHVDDIGIDVFPVDAAHPFNRPRSR